MKHTMKYAMAIGMAAGLLMAAGGPARGKAPDGEQHAATSGHPAHGAACLETKPDAHAGHAHQGEGGDPLADCEHRLPIYQCAECRYEVGVVKADAALWRNAQGGLLAALTVSNRPARTAITLTGEVQLNENTAVHLSPRVAGVIESVAVDIGATVQAGDELFAINSLEFGRALSNYELSRVLAALAEKNYAREKNLLAQKASSEQELIAAQMHYEQQRAEFKAAGQALQAIGLTAADMAELNDDARETKLGRLATRAPIGGTVVEKHAVIGELVEPGRDVMLVADLAALWVWAHVNERDLAALIAARTDGPITVEVAVNAYPGRTFAGQMDYIGATMDEQTRTVKVRATVANPDGALRPGMFCEVRAALGAAEPALIIPRAAVLSDEGRDFVFVHWRDDYYMRRFITRGRDFPAGIEVREGLTPGEHIVATGAFLMKSDVLREKMGAGCAD